MPAARPSQTRRARAARRRSRRVAASGSDLTATEWFEILDAWRRCAYCGADGVALQKDCVLPISRGGRYTVGNVVPACRSCNASKSNEEVTVWMRRRRLDEPAFLVAWYEISAALAARAAAAAAGEDAPAEPAEHADPAGTPTPQAGPPLTPVPPTG